MVYTCSPFLVTFGLRFFISNEISFFSQHQLQELWTSLSIANLSVLSNTAAGSFNILYFLFLFIIFHL